MAGAATSVIFVATKHVFCRDKSMLVATKQDNFCRDKRHFVRQKFCPDKHTFVATKDVYVFVPPMTEGWLVEVPVIAHVWMILVTN